MKTLVLGVNGHIGSNLVRRLLAEGRDVRGFVRPHSDRRSLLGLDIELVEGDVRDRAAVTRAIVGCDRIYHLATPTIETPAVMQIAVDGTRNVLEAARGNVERLVYTSSVVTLGYTRDASRPVTESSFQPNDTTAYQAAKFAAERWLLSFLEEGRGPEVVIVKPTTTLGPLDFRPTPANRTIVEFMKKGSPIAFEAGLTIADVEDVAAGHLQAERRGQPGQAYILGGEQMRVADLFTSLARILRIAPPRFHLPRWLMVCLAGGLEAASLITRRPPLMTVRQARRFVGSYAFYSSAKACRELGYTWRPADQTLRRTVQWFLSTDLLPKRRRSFLEGKIANAA